MANIFIKFPRTQQEFNTIRRSFMNRFQLPGIIGAIDGTHVAILKPSNDEHNFINRKGFHSLNVQIVCDPNLIILNVNANFGGSTHDSFIWRQSQLKQFLHNLYENGHRGFWLIGDSGYPLEPYLLTPFHEPNDNTPEAEFNNRLNSARNTIERCIGVLKMRFRCMLKERTARYSPQFMGQLIIACVALHNMCIENNMQLNNNLPVADEFRNVQLPDNFVNNLLDEGQRVRQNIVNRYI